MYNISDTLKRANKLISKKEVEYLQYFAMLCNRILKGYPISKKEKNEVKDNIDSLMVKYMPLVNQNTSFTEKVLIKAYLPKTIKKIKEKIA